MLISVLKKGGDLYDTIWWIIKRINAFNDIENEDELIEFWYKIAIYFGVSIKMVLDHPPVDFFIEDPADDFPEANTF
jgi:hypothetical protein